MIKSYIIAISGKNIGYRNDDYFTKLTHIQNYLMIRIVDTSEKYLSNVEGGLIQGNFVHIW